MHYRSVHVLTIDYSEGKNNKEKNEVCTLKKESFLDDMRKTFRSIYPEKTDEEIERIIGRSYDKFKDVIDNM